MRPATKVGRYRTGSMWARANTREVPAAPKNKPNLFVMAGKINPLKNSSSARGPMTITNNPMIMFWASAPPTYSTSYSGSGLPYPNPEISSVVVPILSLQR